MHILFIKEEEKNLSIPSAIIINPNNILFLYQIGLIQIEDEEIEMEFYNQIFHSIENN